MTMGDRSKPSRKKNRLLGDGTMESLLAPLAAARQKKSGDGCTKLDDAFPADSDQVSLKKFKMNCLEAL